MSLEPFGLHQGHVLDLLAQMEPESVQVVVTSPPYPGQRSYAGEQAVIWGGDPNCPHGEVQATAPPPTKNATQGSTETVKHPRLVEHYTGRTRWQHVAQEAQEQGIPVRDVVPGAWEKIDQPAKTGGTEHSLSYQKNQVVPAQTSALCTLCGAWYGSLGLEPLISCGRSESGLLELRGDLTEEERDYVVSELRKTGLI